MATIDGARALGMEKSIGSLEPGKRADLIAVSMAAARQTPIYDPLSHLVYVTRGDDVRTTIVNGKVLMRDRKMLTLDENAVLAEARTWTARVACRGRPAALKRTRSPDRKPRADMDILIDEATHPGRIRELAAQIEADYPHGEEIHLVCVLKGGFVFMSDLVRAMRPRVTMDFIAVSSYGKSTKSSGEVRLLKDLDSGLEGRHVIIVEDIVDTGLTLTYLQDILRARAPKSLKTACLLSKPSRRLVDVTVDYIGFSIEDKFVVGYGLDYAEKYRNLDRHRRAGQRMKRFEIITEADARTLDIGTTVELAAGGQITPLAKDTLAARRVSVVPAGTSDAALPADLAPPADIRRVAMGNDHSASR